jgi:uncharacterized membrane protein YjgN (DUF898 family)
MYTYTYTGVSFGTNKFDVNPDMTTCAKGMCIEICMFVYVHLYACIYINVHIYT